MVSTHHILPSLVNYNTLKTPVAQEGREVTIAENPEVCQNGTCWVNVAQTYAVQPIELPDLRVPPPVLLPPQESWQNIHNQDPMNPNETVIVIRSLVPGGVAQLYGRLIPGDRLLFVNDVKLENASLETAVQALKVLSVELSQIVRGKRNVRLHY
ncbi:hypothetical protein QYM36_005731 [Artemia franciscana]|uniref:PDZ domain-containing protein n=1 Tax=Artemia franciscana TaxID=6661 RepID=A0AA88L683_ARTSF|nr:hypothetical protein QYM36_005731 [Artemia franciscana]